MKLHCHPISPYARKAMILSRLKGLSIDEVTAKADGARGYTDGANPLGKIPALEISNHTPVLFDSSVICEYLDTLQSPILAQSGPERWAQLRLHALGDGISDAVYNYRYESVRPDNLHWAKMLKRHTTALEMAVDALASDIDALGTPWTFGNLSVICALDYMSFRAPHIDWKERAPDLMAWHAEFTAYAAYRDTYAYET